MSRARPSSASGGFQVIADSLKGAAPRPAPPLRCHSNSVYNHRGGPDPGSGAGPVVGIAITGGHRQVRRRGRSDHPVILVLVSLAGLAREEPDPTPVFSLSRRPSGALQWDWTLPGDVEAMKVVHPKLCCEGWVATPEPEQGHRMNVHKNARLTVHGRVLLVRRVMEEGWTVAAASVAASAQASSGWRATAPVARQLLPIAARRPGDAPIACPTRSSPRSSGCVASG